MSSAAFAFAHAPLTAHASPAAAVAEVPPAPALAYFDARSFDDAAPLARALVAAARACPRCRNLLAHRFERLGSTLFRDEDPAQLLHAFDLDDRDGSSLRLLAACVVLYGRDRVAVSPGCSTHSTSAT